MLTHQGFTFSDYALQLHFFSFRALKSLFQDRYTSNDLCNLLCLDRKAAAVVPTWMRDALLS